MTYPRFCQEAIKQALADTPLIIVTGARQTGKSTLVSQFNRRSSFTFDDWSTFQAAKNNPEGFIQTLAKNPLPILLDEVQLVPEIFLPLKKRVDQHRQPGLFILTGSANLLNWEGLPDSLAGRTEYITLHPLSLSEIMNHQPTWIDQIFVYDFADLLNVFQKSLATAEHIERFLTRGGYPEPFKRDQASRRSAWHESYIKALLERDVRSLDTVENPFILRQLLTHLALTVGSTLNFTNLALKLQTSLPTVRKYFRLLGLLYLCHELKPWHRNLGKRIIKSPKIFLNDVGLVQYLVPSQDPSQRGVLMEQFVFNELQKQISWSQTKPELYFWRTSEGKEIDFVMEDKQGKVFALEVKAKSTLNASDFSHLKILQQNIPGQFLGGIVVYNGDKVLPFGTGLYGVPVTHLF